MLIDGAAFAGVPLPENRRIRFGNYRPTIGNRPAIERPEVEPFARCARRMLRSHGSPGVRGLCDLPLNVEVEQARNQAVCLAVFGRECPAQLANLVERLLAKSPADRPASAAEVAATLQAIIADPEIKPSLGTDALGDVSVQSQSLTERLQNLRSPSGM